MNEISMHDYLNTTAKRIIEEFGLEPISTDLKSCNFEHGAILNYNLQIPLFARLYKEDDCGFFQDIRFRAHCMNYEGLLIRLSFTPYYLFFYLWPGGVDDFKNICQSRGGIKNLMKILNYLKINISFAKKYNLK